MAEDASVPSGAPDGAAAEGLADWQASPNVNARRHGGDPDMVVVHYTAMASAEDALRRLCDACPPEGLGPVSCHYLISETGRIWQMVRERDRAWHAGVGAWGGREDVNSHSIGIELANTGLHPFPEPQMAALEALLPGILARWAIAPARVIGHSDMAPGRKIDPGPRFDWRRLARQGLSVWPGAAGEGDFHADLARFGYPVEAVAEADLLEAFRARFRPHGRGPVSAEDRRIARDLAERFPARAGAHSPTA